MQKPIVFPRSFPWIDLHPSSMKVAYDPHGLIGGRGADYVTVNDLAEWTAADSGVLQGPKLELRDGYIYEAELEMDDAEYAAADKLSLMIGFSEDPAGHDLKLVGGVTRHETSGTLRYHCYLNSSSYSGSDGEDVHLTRCKVQLAIGDGGVITYGSLRWLTKSGTTKLLKEWPGGTITSLTGPLYVILVANKGGTASDGTGPHNFTFTTLRYRVIRA